MNIWFCTPVTSGVVATPCMSAWKKMGYRTAVSGITTDMRELEGVVDLLLVRNKYMGTCEALNYLWQEVGERADAFIYGGQDIWPDWRYDAKDAGKIYLEHFPKLEGVMQPIGDHFGCIDVAAVDPWIGRNFALRVYGGRGPLWPGYYHFWSDRELFDVATMLGVYVAEPRLSQYHSHWSRESNPRRPVHMIKPAALHTADGEEYQRRKAAGFPGALDTPPIKPKPDMGDTV